MTISEYYANGYDLLIGDPLIVCNCDKPHTDVEVVAYYVCDDIGKEAVEEYPVLVSNIYSEATH